MSETLDKRLHPVRPDLAARSYEGRVDAARFVEGTKKRVACALAPIRPEPRPDKSIDTEALFGEVFTVYEETAEGWAWGQLETDGYVGFMASDALIADAPVPTHRLAALRSYRYPYAELKSPPLELLSMGSLVAVAGYETTRGLDYALLADGSAIVAKHLVPLDHSVDDWVSVAESLAGTPYLWGGRSSLGLDCSAIVQLAAQAGGMAIMRDTYMQAETAGEALDISSGLPDLKRGDLVFWKGHIGIMRDAGTLLHANGFTMMVSSEPLESAIARIREKEGSPVTAVRRLNRP
ncbi:C40 family peptidase [Rhizobiales bacterium]|uniref:C40 family peptidase n=1 Tax=Hongsoonwoonella zoysiae TaxID=2821844 RepID=UPI0015619202|nr:NlpC/P60 family protein [Hongsoonwoonella zoysiae]NRG16125.1 C40 family peptidase [Hongsoonwoonella zoysiae]